MTNEELQYVDSLKREIERLENEVKNLTEEKDEALRIASKYMNKYIQDNNLSDEVAQGVKAIFNSDKII